jgi:hypothetical protein
VTVIVCYEMGRSREQGVVAYSDYHLVSVACVRHGKCVHNICRKNLKREEYFEYLAVVEENNDNFSQVFRVFGRDSVSKHPE